MLEMLTPLHRGHPESGEASMALAILTQAIDDLRRRKLWSLEWFSSPSFEFWLAVVDPELDAGVLRDAILKRFSNAAPRANASAAEKRERCREVLAQTPDATLCDVARRVGCSAYLVGKVRDEMREEQHW